MEYNFTEVMSKKTDLELIKILTTEREGYRPEAIEAAELEVQSRNIDVSKIEAIKISLELEAETEHLVGSENATLTLRFIHSFVDLVGVWFLSLILIFFWGLYVPFDEELINGMVYVIMFIAFLLYYIVLETVYQKTPAKWITGTHVVTVNGEKPDIKTIITRTFCRLIPFDKLSFVFSDNGFHDSISGTIVVKDSAVAAVTKQFKTGGLSKEEYWKQWQYFELLEDLHKALNMLLEVKNSASSNNTKAARFHAALEEAVEDIEFGNQLNLTLFYDWFAPEATWERIMGQIGEDIGNSIYHRAYAWKLGHD